MKKEGRKSREKINTCEPGAQIDRKQEEICGRMFKRSRELMGCNLQGQ